MTEQNQETQKYVDRILHLEQRKIQPSLNSLIPSQLEMYKKLNHLFGKDEKLFLSLDDISEKISMNVRSRTLLLSDFCYKNVNIEDKELKFVIKKRINKEVKYRFVGTGYSPEESIAIKWSIRSKHCPKINGSHTVGQYHNHTYTWNFSKLKQSLQRLKTGV